jgi:hypothetical protein
MDSINTLGRGRLTLDEEKKTWGFAQTISELKRIRDLRILKKKLKGHVLKVFLKKLKVFFYFKLLIFYFHIILMVKINFRK